MSGLAGKKVYAFGDSIVYGHTDPDNSFMRLIEKRRKIDLHMYAVNGATIIQSDNDILTQVLGASEEIPDIILFDGYVNDAYEKTMNVLGKIETDVESRELCAAADFGDVESSHKDAAELYDDQTFCGGFEKILYTMRKRWGEVPIIYVVPHQSAARGWDIQCRLRELALEICHKWKVEIVDIFQNAKLDTRDPEQMREYIIDGAGSHPNVKACQEFYIPLINTELNYVCLYGNRLNQRVELSDQEVDLVVFAGQSNMAGRGDQAEAVQCDVNAGYEYKALGAPDRLFPIVEPFGLGEDKGGIINDDDTTGIRTYSGSMASAFANAYYKKTGRAIVGVSAAIGGTSTTQWKEKWMKEAEYKVETAKHYLKENDIHISRMFVVWNQGESDGDEKRTAKEYLTNIKELYERFKKAGAEKCFVIQIGHFNYLSHPEERKGLTGAQWDAHYQVIRDAQIRLCEEDARFVLAGSFEPYIKEMKDPFHYKQSAYNAVGEHAGNAVADYYANKQS